MEIEEEIDDENNNSTNSEEICVLDDYYESIAEEKKNLIQQLQISSSNEKIANLKNENKNKLNKLKLLLYQKFLNIMSAIISLNIKKSFKIFTIQANFIKIKNLGYKINTDNKKFKCPDFYVKSLMKQIQRKEKLEKIKDQYILLTNLES